jgi:protein involved in polysaccharide export with SLBB domain
MNISIVSKAIVVLGLSWLVAACETIAPASEPMVTSVTATAVAPAAPVELRLAAGDRLQITVFGEDKLTGEYPIDIGGNVSMPLAGTVKAAGLSKAELERALASKLSGEYLRDPKVTVEVATFRPFYILGEVEKPGEYPYKSGLNVMSAMAVAGGPTYRASNSKILIQRGGVGAFQEVALSPTVAIYPGDLVRVPERFF